MSAAGAPPEGSGPQEEAARREWDADTYHRVAAPQERWGRAVLERLELRGDETVLDAGCGSGRVTRLIADRLPRGRVIAVDASPEMVERARAALGSDAEVLVGNLTELRIDEQVDAVFSSAVFHWIADHDLLFRRVHDSLRPGGRLVAQCGGEGNIARFLDGARAASEEPPFSQFLGGWAGNWYFASPEATSRALEGAGFRDVHCWTEPSQEWIPEARDYLSTVCLGAHLERLPEAMHEDYVDTVLERVAEPAGGGGHAGVKDQGVAGPGVRFDYVRLNMDARRP